MSMNAPETMGVIYRLQLSQLHPHPQNPFSIRDDQTMLDLIQSVQSHGVVLCTPHFPNHKPANAPNFKLYNVEISKSHYSYCLHNPRKKFT